MTNLEINKIERHFGFWYKSLILLSGMAIIALRTPFANWRTEESVTGFLFVVAHVLYAVFVFYPSRVAGDRFSIIWLIDSMLRLAFAGYLMVMTDGDNLGILLYFPLVLVGILVGQPPIKMFFLFGGEGWLIYSTAAYLDRGMSIIYCPSYWQNAFLNGLLFFAGMMVIQLITKLGSLAATDALTGLGNRRFFTQKLDEEIARSERYGHHLSLIMLDLDNFKLINDKLGHPVGDKALVNSAYVIQKNLKLYDIACRYGGDEFAVILPQTTVSEAQKIAERLVANVSEVDFPGRQRFKGSGLTASAGVATFPVHCQGAFELVEKADMALVYQSKREKNSVATYSPSLESRH